MSFLRATSLARSAAFSARRFSTETPAATKKSSNLPYYLITASAVGFGAYFYLGGTGSNAVPKAFKKTQEKSPLDPNAFVDFKLKKVVPYNHNTSEFVFELPKGEASLLPIASCVVVRASDPEALKDAKGNPVVRPYTPISAPDKEGEMVFLIKKYETGLVSKYIHEQLKLGDTLGIKGPFPKFPYKANEFEQVALIGGGSGITPLYQIVDHALSDPQNKTKFKLIFANVSEKDILLREELDALKKKHPETFDVLYAVDKAGPGFQGHVGFVNADLIKQHVASPSLGEKVKVFVCGPPGQVNALAGQKAGMKQGPIGGILKELGYTEDQVYKF